MSLEQALSANTAAINALLAHLQTVGTVVTGPVTVAAPIDTQPTEVAEAVAAKKPEPTKSKPTSDTSPASSKKSPDPVETAKPEVDYETVKTAVLEVSKKSRATPQESRDQAEALLQRFEVQKISQLGTEAYADVHALAQQIMAGKDATAAELPEGAEGLE